MLIGTLVTRQIQDLHSPNKEHGNFELPVKVIAKQLETSGAPKEFAKRAIATHLASAVIDTEVPKEYWGFKPTMKLQKAFNWPELLPMGVS